ncbi:hypothetical protein BX286_4264 [Streptomyces sp. 3211.6]|uniref:hypothetical protein n=1 Tax=Streptomyces TaxID=1883 RepID=UPI000F29FCB2|nr:MULTISPECIES: hypothetical protein [Streptomyces]RKT06226.1 hypothetical protein BX286_4264 [Streptomyces sp. 3211.6]RPF46237.1 hypothetical protein EDD96_2808 [Streptomyces sp. Ag109_G2-6]
MHSSPHRTLRTAAFAAAGLAAALTLTACGSDGSSKPDAKPSAPAASTPTAAPTAGAGTATGAAGGAGTLDGGWISMQNPGKSVVLTVKGQKALVVEAATGLTCEGSSNGTTLDLKCPPGATRSKGKVDSVDATTLKVTWEGAGQDTFQKSDPGKLPSLPPLPTKK